jgi:polyketide cyclase/dehydrase/lipid transport protein
MPTITDRAVLDAPTVQVWALLRDFAAIGEWHPFLPPVQIENGPADRVGATRVFPQLGGHRETLVALDDLTWTASWRFDDSGGLPVRDYVSTLRVIPLGDERVVVDWSARFDCDADDEPAVRTQILDQVFRPGLGALADRFRPAVVEAGR